jgi:hypothetical protein
VYSITIAQIDSNNAIIVLFKDGDGDGILNAEREAPLYFANTEATMQHIESLEK